MSVTEIELADVDAGSRFASSMHENSFAILAGHPFDSSVFTTMSAEWLAFFGSDAKDRYQHAPDSQDGYFPPPASGARVADGQLRDRKEFFHVRSGGPYPTDVSDLAMRYFDEAMRLAALLLGWLDRAALTVTLDTGPAYAQMIAGSTGSTLRIQHYLPLTGYEPAGSLRALEHEDLNLITLLPAPATPGLQLKTPAGDWIDIPADTNLLVVNGGRMLELASGGVFPAAPHRVRYSGRETGSRLSFPLFVHPRADVDLGGGLTAQAFLARQVAELARRGWAVAPGDVAGKG